MFRPVEYPQYGRFVLRHLPRPDIRNSLQRGFHFDCEKPRHSNSKLFLGRYQFIESWELRLVTGLWIPCRSSGIWTPTWYVVRAKLWWSYVRQSLVAYYWNERWLNQTTVYQNERVQNLATLQKAIVDESRYSKFQPFHMLFNRVLFN